MTQVAIDASVLISSALTREASHAESLRFVRHVYAQRIGLIAPGLLLIESAFVRRTGSESLAREATTDILKHRLLKLDTPESAERLSETIDVGIRTGLRGADAIYAATAERYDVPLVSWDRELITRAGAITPTDWMARIA